MSIECASSTESTRFNNHRVGSTEVEGSTEGAVEFEGMTDGTKLGTFEGLKLGRSGTSV
jgi:hypothetical protein